jgi:phage terminase Nu1 subunit (DNA packaging protein)
MIEIRSLPPHSERYVTRKELAEIMGVSLRTIDTFIAEGMPSELWGQRTRRLRPSEAIRWARERRG